MTEFNAEIRRSDPEEVVVLLGLDIYNLDAITRAAHRFTDHYFVRLEQTDDCHVRCLLQAKRLGEASNAVVGAFTNEVLDQMLRAKLAAETEQTRLLLLAHAFSKTNILHPEFDQALPSSDPLRIGEPDGKAG